MAMSLKVIVPNHPLIKHWLSILREKDTPHVLFTTGYEQIGKWLTYEAIRNWLPYKKELINTSTGNTEGVFIDNNFPIQVFTNIPEGLVLWSGSKEVIPNATLNLGELPEEISSNKGIIIYSQIITIKNNPLDILSKLYKLGVESKRILIIACVCSDRGLNKIAKVFPNQVIFTSCIDEEEDISNILKPGIGDPLLRLSTKYIEKN